MSLISRVSASTGGRSPGGGPWIRPWHPRGTPDPRLSAERALALSKDITTAGPSRRQIAKGAAWAVPAVTVAAAAPALAASPDEVCAPGASTLMITVENCSGVTVLGSEPVFRISNPETATCTVPAGTAVSLTTRGIATINLLGDDLLNAGVLYDEGGTVALRDPLAPGDSVLINLFPDGLNVTAVGSITLAVDGKSATMGLLADVLGGLVSVCRAS